MQTLSFEFLVFNKSSETFFVSGIFKGDRYATAYAKADKKFPSRLYIIVGENKPFLKWAGIVNAWITPSGEFIPCGYMGHNDFASEFCANMGMGWEPDSYDYPYQVLCKREWLRLLTWSDDANKAILIGDDYHTLPNHKQAQTAKDWALINKVPFASLFKEHQVTTLGLWLGKQ